MAKKATKTPVIKTPSKIEVLKTVAQQFFSRLLYPSKQEAFSVRTYEVTTTGTSGVSKKPNAISAPELAAIVGTAGKLGKNVEIRLNGHGDGGTLTFYFVDQPATAMPAELY